MGIFAPHTEAVRGVGDKPDWINEDDEYAGARMTSAGVRVNARIALGLTTVWRCVDLLSSAVSQAPKDIVVKVGGRSFQEFGKPGWLIMPNPSDPTYTINDYFSQVALSLLMDGNFFVHVYPDVYDPIVLTVLPPGQVDVRSGPTYDLRDASGRVIREGLSPAEILHGTWIRLAGALRGISPLEALRRGIGSAVAAEDHAARFFGQGASLSFGVEVPGGMDIAQKKELAENLKARYAGLGNSHAIGVLTGGAKFVPGLAPTPEQAQMLATRQFSVDDLCRPYGVPPSMAGSQQPGSSSYASAEVWREEFRDYAALPLALRIEAHHNRLVRVPDTITDPNAEAQFKFNLDHVARTNLLTRYQAYKEGVLGGFLQPAEARAREDLPPVEGADQLFLQQQMVPITGLAPTRPLTEVT